jgi:AcrR family transcriptional regulator
MSTMPGSMAGDHDRTAELLWGLRERPSRGPKPTLDIGRIARAAMEIADTDGLAAVSMQRVAEALDVTKMALYRYVTGKAELIAVMIEAAIGEPPDLDGVPGDWRSKIEQFGRDVSASWQRHPWLPWVTIGDRVMGPNEIGWIERAVATLEGTGLDGGERLDAVFILFGHLRNTQSMGTAGTQPWTTGKRVSPAMRELFRKHGDRYPALTAAVGSAVGSSRDNGREFGLQRILDGLQVHIAARSSASDQRGLPIAYR